MDGAFRLPGDRQDQRVFPGADSGIKRLSRSTNIPVRIKFEPARIPQNVKLPIRECQVMQQPAMQEEKFDLAGMVADPDSPLRLKTAVRGVKMFPQADERAAILKVSGPTAVQPTSEIV